MAPRISLTQYLVEKQREKGLIPAELRMLLEVVARACKRIGYAVSRGAIDGVLGEAGSSNVQGEAQKKLDVIANEALLEANEWGGNLAAMASEEMDHPYTIPHRYPKGEFLLLFDPLDGSSNIDVNVSIGTIFSVLRLPEGVGEPQEAHFLQPGTKQVAAGYAVYGPSTLLVLTADRPWDLLGVAAPQTMDQHALFGVHVRAFLELGLHEPMLKEGVASVSYTHLRAHATVLDILCRLPLEKKNTQKRA